MWIRSLGLGLALLLAVTAPVTAQDDWVELLRSDLRADKVAIVTAAMNLAPDQADVFWPIYRQHDAALVEIGDRRLALIEDYAENWEDMSDAWAKQLMKKWFGIQDDRAKLAKGTYRKLEKALSPTVAARFLQIDHQLGLLIDLQVAEQLPLVEPPPD